MIDLFADGLRVKVINAEVFIEKESRSIQISMKEVYTLRALLELLIGKGK